MKEKIPYHRPWIGPEEIEAVTRVLQSGWLTSGPVAAEFENRFAAFTGSANAIAVNSCTSGLFLLMRAHGIGPGMEVITSPLTFAASANTILHCGAVPVFADIDLATGNVDPKEVEKKINPRTKAILAVHLGGQGCDMDALSALAKQHNLLLLEDCAHAFAGSWKNKALGTIGDGAAFSFYATKNITTGEGGMVLVEDESIAKKIKLLRLHGMSRTVWERSQGNLEPLYDIMEPGYKCNLSDMNAAIGIAQMNRWPEMKARLENIRRIYQEGLEKLSPKILLTKTLEGAEPGWHLFMVRLNPSVENLPRAEFMSLLAESGIETSINYFPLHLMNYYQHQFGYRPDDFMNALEWGITEVSLPFYAAMSDEEAKYVVQTISKILK